MDDVYSDMKQHCLSGGLNSGRLGDGNSHGSSSKHSDSMSDDIPPLPAAPSGKHKVSHTSGPLSGGGGEVGGQSDLQSANTPYEVLMHDLTQAKRQLIELHNLVSQVFLLPYYVRYTVYTGFCQPPPKESRSLNPIKVAKLSGFLLGIASRWSLKAILE